MFPFRRLAKGACKPFRVFFRQQPFEAEGQPVPGLPDERVAGEERLGVEHPRRITRQLVENRMRAREPEARSAPDLNAFDSRSRADQLADVLAGAQAAELRQEQARL